MDKKLIVLIGLVVMGLIVSIGFHRFANTSQRSSIKRISIIVPLAHPALDQIVDGFVSTLNSLAPGTVYCDVKNANGDQNIQHTLINQAVQQQADIIVPIGTLATQMTVNTVSEQTPIVALACKKELIASPYANITGVHDEVNQTTQFEFIHTLLPKACAITALGSNNEKTIPEIKNLQAIAKEQHVDTKAIYIQSLPDLYLATQSIDTKTEAICLFKDHLTARGAPTIVEFAQRHNIPVIASDEGTVKQGAACALGIKERSIGQTGATLAYKILTGTSVRDIPVQELSDLTVFVNDQTCSNQGLTRKYIGEVAKKLGYEVQLI